MSLFQKTSPLKALSIPLSLRMAEALGEVQTSLQRNLAAQKGGPLTSNWGG